MLKSVEPCLIVTFYTTADAIAMETYCRSHDISGRLIPVPRSITADCGMAWKTSPNNRAALEEGIRDGKLDVAGCFDARY